MTRRATAFAAIAATVLAVTAAGCGDSPNAAGFSSGQIRDRAEQVQAAADSAEAAITACLPGGQAVTRTDGACVGPEYRKVASALDEFATYAARYQATEPAGACQDALKEVSRLGGALANGYSDVARRFAAGQVAAGNTLLANRDADDVGALTARAAEWGTDVGGVCG